MAHAGASRMPHSPQDERREDYEHPAKDTGKKRPKESMDKRADCVLEARMC